MKTLVIIDMQDDFLRNHTKEKNVIEISTLIYNVVSLVNSWKENNWPILIIEFDGYGRTVSEIQDAIHGYKYASIVTKNDCDGSDEILEEIKNDLSKDLNICGVFSDQCVQMTIDGLDKEDNVSVYLEVYDDCVWPFLSETGRYSLENTEVSYLGALSCQSQCSSQLT